jgi:hypothetical protein
MSMGFFGTYLFDGRAWHDFDPDSDPISKIARPWLSVDIHDSDIGTIRYEPPGPGTGIAYLGFTPRTYFGTESASAPTDVLLEAQGVASWLARRQSRNDEAELAELIAPFLAHDGPGQQHGSSARPRR